MDLPVARFSTRRLRLAAVLGTLCSLTLLSLGLQAETASAAAPPSATDVMFIFDTSGSMGGVLEEAKSEVQEVTTQIAGTVPNPAFGVSEVKDTGEEEGGFYAWKLDSPITTNTTAVKEAIEPLTAEAGGDSPEAYGRALYEAATNPDVGWRPGAKHLIILIADEVPHDPEINAGIPAQYQLQAGELEPYFDDGEGTWPSTGEELEATAGIKDTQWKSGVKIQFKEDLERLVKEEKPLSMVDIHDTEGDFVHYWETWAGSTGGKAVEGTEGGHDLASRISVLTEEGVFGTLPGCPTGQRRNSASLCVPLNPTTSQVICNLVIATASDTCTATVADASTTETKNPTGTVSFTSAAGGVFSAGNSCTLVATPLSPNVSSCSVTYLPPTMAGTAPAITANYAGDALHAGSSAKTTYPPASELEKDVTLTDTGTITSDEVEVPFDCGFPCSVSSGLYSGPSLGSISAVGAVSFELAEVASSKHHKSHKPKPKLLGSGKVKLKAAGKGMLKIRIASKYRRAFSKIKGTVKLTLKIQTRTLAGTIVGSETLHVTLKPKKKHKKH
jgi:hypothetical protein